MAYRNVNVSRILAFTNPSKVDRETSCAHTVAQAAIREGNALRDMLKGRRVLECR